MLNKFEKFTSMFLNGAIGDQYGAPIEMMPSELVIKRYGEYISEYILNDKISDKPYTYTDDTQMTISVLHLLIDNDISEIDNTMVLKYYLREMSKLFRLILNVLMYHRS
jgi:ADP-ribosylglycohydrolase